MTPFTEHKLALSELLGLIPDDIFKELSQAIQVDYYTKVLYRKLMFNLLFYAILTVDKLGQRGLADLYASPHFRMLFYLETKKQHISHNSLSDRLSVMNVDYFKQVYDYVYQRYSNLYPVGKISGPELQRVDSSLVSETSNKLREGMTCGNEYKKKKMLKYTISTGCMEVVPKRIVRKAMPMNP
jgi:hypothetical protein